MRQQHIPALAIAAFLLATIFSSPDAQAQCKTFIKNACLAQLNPYLHDGSYQAAMMSDGEEAEVYKTIFAGQRYRLMVCIDNTVPHVEFVVSDIRRTFLFDSRKNGNVTIWDFKSDVSQQIKVTIRIPKSQKQGDAGKEPVFGCVGVLFGLLE
jgi:hypothetical protein